jgi:hypothetical protein
LRRGHENDSREKTCLYPSSEPVPLLHLESTKRPIQLDASLLKAASPDQSNAQPRFAREFEDVGKPQRFDIFIYECLDAVLNQIEDMDANRWIPGGTRVYKAKSIQVSLAAWISTSTLYSYPICITSMPQ